MALERPTLWDVAKAAAALIPIAVVLVGGIWVITRLSLLFLAIFVATLVTAVLAPATAFLRARRFPGSLAALVPLLIGLVAVGAAFAWIVPQAVAEVRNRGADILGQLDRLAYSVTRFLPGDPASLEQLLARAGQALRSNAQTIAGTVAAGLVQAAEVLTGALLALVLSFFFLRDGEGLYQRVTAGMPSPRRETVRAAVGGAWSTLGAWFRATALIALADAFGIGLGLVIVGVPLALPLALFTFLGGFVPVVGATVAGGAAVVVALAANGPLAALIILGVVLGVQQLEGNVLQPWLMGRFVPLHPAAILIALTAGALLWGLAGAFVAVPLAAAGAAAFFALRTRWEMGHPTPPAPPPEG